MAGATTTMRRLVHRIGVTPANMPPLARRYAAIAAEKSDDNLDAGRHGEPGALHLDELDPQLFYEQLRGHTRHWTMDS